MFTIIVLVTDCGTEFENQTICQLLSDNGIRLILTCPHTSERHGQIEWVGWATDDMSRCMLIESKLEEVW